MKVEAVTKSTGDGCLKGANCPNPAARPPNAKRPTLADWPKCLNMLVVMGGLSQHHHDTAVMRAVRQVWSGDCSSVGHNDEKPATSIPDSVIQALGLRCRETALWQAWNTADNRRLMLSY
jgi:hypothetical protein